MNRSELIDRIKFYLNVNDGQTDQDVTDARLVQLLDLQYTELVTRAKQEGISDYFKKTSTDTWDSGELTFVIPNSLNQHSIMRIMDVTAGEPGGSIDIGSASNSTGIFWLDNRTLQWGTDGPASNVSLRFYYVAQAEALLSNTAEPLLIPPEHHNLLVWATAIEFRSIADDEVPQRWLERKSELEMAYHKAISRGKPWDNEPWIRPRESDFNERGTV